MTIRGSGEESIGRDEGPWRAFVEDLRRLAGTATLAELSAKMGYSASELTQRLNPANRDIPEQFVRAYAEACGANPEEWAQRRREALEALTTAGASGDPQLFLSAERSVGTLEPHPAGPRSFRHRFAVIAFAAASGLVVLTGTVVKALLDDTAPPPDVAPSAASSDSPALVIPTVTHTVTPSAAPAVSAKASSDPPQNPPAKTSSDDPPANAAGLPTHECRDNWTKSSVELVFVMPCIKRDSGGISIYTKIRSDKQSGSAQEVTVWIWLMKHDRHLVQSRQAHLTRSEKSLRRCRMRLPNGGRVMTCGPFKVPPPDKAGSYTTSSSVRTHDAAYPPGWDDPGFSGTQGGLVTWP